ncbi:DUF6817 domain-containing protein [Amycolatopsis nigrescens]|uniref:DUF6817 domain-containing protein n=1 Tax=Amycolatopsis nigrescens TaxID=381445 RepID=UPI0003776C1A|nr:hypothetical protein [Amycolatopsis nigrescens]
MEPDASVAVATELLAELGAGGVAHPGGTLLAHLCRVQARLSDWEARPALRLAGLCHAAYGTDGFPTGLLPLAERDRLRGVIGDEAEEIVYVYAGCDRSKSYPALAGGGPLVDRFSGNAVQPAGRLRRDFAELTAANELDLVRVSTEFRERWGAAIRELLQGFRPLLSELARRDLDDLLPA